MGCILNIETSTNICSIALTVEDEVVFSKESFEGPSHATLLGVFVEEALAFIDANSLKLVAVAVSCGPGSYTGLRIGVSMAKGLCFGYGLPLISIPTLELLANKAISVCQGKEQIYCPMLDARRMEVYAAMFDNKLNQLRATAADIVDENTYAEWLKSNKVCFFGNGAAKCMDVIASDNAILLEGIEPLASDMARLSAKAFAENKFEDVAYFEPFYLKEFVATVAKNKVL